ncbi:MAG: mucoidy inhibitor MuiA family protein [Candidatus Thorarchaeota archaeon]
MIELKTKTSEVTVFRDGARVTRTGEIELERGRHDIVIRGLSRTVSYDSVRVNGLGDVTLLNLTLEPESAAATDRDRIQELKEQLRGLERERDQLNDEIKRHKLRESQLVRLAQSTSFALGKRFAHSDAEPETIGAIAEGMRRELTALRKRVRECEVELRRVEDKIKAVEDTLEQLSFEDDVVRRMAVLLRLEVPKKCKLDLGITYQVGRAWWTPRYDVNLTVDAAHVKHIAMVMNQTDEDWTDVILSVSTASARPVEIVEPRPFYITRFVPRPPPAPSSMTRKKMRALAAPAPEEAEKAEEQPEAEPMDELSAEVKEEFGGIVTYRVPGTVTIQSEETPKPVTLIERRLDSKRYYFWNAAESEFAVVAEKVTNGDSTLLPGAAKVFADGEYVGESELELIAPHEEFEIGTRTAHDVRVEKKLLAQQTEKAGLRGKNRRLYEYELTIKNFTDSQISVETMDRIPYSSSEKIRVSLRKTSVEYDKIELGLITWKLEIPPREEKRITYEFEVEWEREVSVTPPLP